MRIRTAALVLIATFLFTVSAVARQRSAPSVMTMQIEGVIKSVSTSSLVVTGEHGQDVSLTIIPATIFRSEDAAIAPTDLKTGDRVEVKAAMSNNVLNALVVNLQASDQEQPESVEVSGVIKSVSSLQMVVTDAALRDTTVAIDDNTRIFKNGQPATAADLAVGDRVEVKAAMISNMLTALVVNAEAPETEQPELVEIDGVIKSISSAQVVVTNAALHDTTIAIDGHTRIFKNDHAATVGDLAAGDQVEVKASASGTTMTAVFISAEAPENENEDVDVQGTVSAVGSSQITISTGDHGDVMVNVDANTRIRRGDQTIAIGDIHVGDKAEAQGTRVDSHTILAREIEVQSSSNGD